MSSESKKQPRYKPISYEEAAVIKSARMTWRPLLDHPVDCSVCYDHQRQLARDKMKTRSDHLETFCELIFLGPGRPSLAREPKPDGTARIVVNRWSPPPPTQTELQFSAARDFRNATQSKARERKCALIYMGSFGSIRFKSFAKKTSPQSVGRRRYSMAKEFKDRATAVQLVSDELVAFALSLKATELGMCIWQPTASEVCWECYIL
jgi:hypothetical protein